MEEFRDGKRSDPRMSPMTKPLSDEDIEDLAVFFNSLPVCDEYQQTTNQLNEAFP